MDEYLPLELRNYAKNHKRNLALVYIRSNNDALNEIFVAEREVCKTSTFQVTADGRWLGKFKSSGFIISTGTGSTGWLHSAKRVQENTVARILSKFGAQHEPFEVHE